MISPLHPQMGRGQSFIHPAPVGPFRDAQKVGERMPGYLSGQLVLAAGVSFGSGDLFGSCFFYLFSGAIAGTVANFIVRGKLGCLLGNFALGIVGAIVARFILGFLLQFITLPNKNDLSIGFMGTTIIAAIAATLISYIFNTALKAEHGRQAQLVEEHRQERGQS